jgi:hypothetical protein
LSIPATSPIPVDWHVILQWLSQFASGHSSAGSAISMTSAAPGRSTAPCKRCLTLGNGATEWSARSFAQPTVWDLANSILTSPGSTLMASLVGTATGIGTAKSKL